MIVIMHREYWEQLRWPPHNITKAAVGLHSNTKSTCRLQDVKNAIATRSCSRMSWF